MKTGPRTLFPKAHETQIEMTKIIGRNYKVNFRALGGDLISCFGNDGASLCQTWVPELAKEGSPHPYSQTISWRGEGVSGEGRGRQEKRRQRKRKRAGPENWGLEVVCSGTLAESRFSVSSTGFPAPLASLVISGRAANLQNKIKFNSLRRGGEMCVCMCVYV